MNDETRSLSKLSVTRQSSQTMQNMRASDSWPERVKIADVIYEPPAREGEGHTEWMRFEFKVVRGYPDASP